MQNNYSSPLISELLSPARINLNLRTHDRDAVIEELVEQMPELADEPAARQTLLRALREREKLHSTAIGDGIAVPHARNALVGIVSHPVMVFGRHATGIAFGALDSLPVQLFFLLVAPTVTQHLAILARLSRLLRDPKLVQKLLVTETPGKVIAILSEAEQTLHLSR
jgi:mannitol/fructose-specific phosphotransferase system IIA component (Ntr-type)